MRVLRHRRSPRVQNGDDGDLGAKVLGVGGDRQHGVRGGLEQEIIDQRLVLVGNGSDLGG